MSCHLERYFGREKMLSVFGDVSSCYVSRKILMDAQASTCLDMLFGTYERGDIWHFSCGCAHFFWLGCVVQMVSYSCSKRC